MNSLPLRRLLVGAALLSVASLLATFATTSASADPVEPIEVALLSVNDFHGNLDPTHDGTTTVRFAGTIEEQRALHGEDSTLVLSAGDMLKVDGTTQNPRSRQFVPTLKVLNALEVRASAVGNHEFHNWPGTLRTTIVQTADFPLLSANILKSNELPFLAYKKFEVAGLEVAVIGATTRDTPALDARVTLCGLKFTDPVNAVNVTADNLATGPNPPDIIVAVYHEGAQDSLLENDRVGTETSANVDVVFAGHTHMTEKFEGPVPGQPGKKRPVMQSLPNGAEVSEVVLSIDPNTKEVLSFTMKNIPRVTTSKEVLVATYPRAAQVAAIVKDAIDHPPALSTDPAVLC